MQLDFRTHRKARRFPYTLVGVFLTVGFIALFIYFTLENVNVIQLFELQSDKSILDVFYFSFIIFHFLFFIFSFSVAKQLRSGIKVLMVLFQLAFCIIGVLAAYYYESTQFVELLSIYFLLAAGYFVFYLVAFIFQSQSFTLYKSFIVAILSAFPIIPLAVINYSMFKQLDFHHTIVNISLYAYLFSLILYIITNSIYICTINRKV